MILNQNYSQRYSQKLAPLRPLAPFGHLAPPLAPLGPRGPRTPNLLNKLKPPTLFSSLNYKTLHQ